MKNLQEIIKGVIGTLAAVTVVALSTGCGGGGSSIVPGPGPDPSGPAAGTADLSGQLLQAGDSRVTSAAGSALSGLIVALINTATGQLTGNDVTDGMGKFEFSGVPSGEQYLVKVEFESSNDLDGDGQLDQVELFFPVSLAEQSVVSLLQQIGVSDSDGDGQLDAIEVESHLTDDHGLHVMENRQHRRRGGETVEDSNGNGSFDDDPSFSDSDGDGIPDVPISGGSIDDNPTGLFELEVKGFIEAISGESITVGGRSFALTSGTTWRIEDNRSASPSSFTVGMFVEVEGIPDGSGGWIATKVKTEDDFGNDDNDSLEREVRGFIEAISAESITVGGVTFTLTEGTMWRIDENLNASPSSFTVGMFVEVEGISDGQGGFVATKVKTEDDFGDGDDDGLEREVTGSIEAISAESITVAGVTFTLTEGTMWRIEENLNASPSEFTVGMFVEVEGFSDGQGGFIATKVKTEDDFGGDDGSGGDDDGTPDQGGDNDDDGTGDDTGGDDDGTPDQGGDNDDDGTGDDTGGDDDGTPDQGGDNDDDGTGDDTGGDDDGTPDQGGDDDEDEDEVEDEDEDDNSGSGGGDDN